MLDKIEMGDAKQLRKTLLITSFIGISFNALFANATGDFEFFGFKIPTADTSVIPKLVGLMIIYFLIALIIRYNNEKFRERYKIGLDYAKDVKEAAEEFQRGNQMEPDDDDIVFERSLRSFVNDSMFKKFVRVKGIVFLDIYFPLLLAVFAILKIFLLGLIEKP